MTQSQEKPVQQELFFDKRFFIVLNSLISSGEAATLGGNAILIYLILKCNASFETSLTKLGYRRLSELSGIKSYTTIQNAIEKLVDHRLIEKVHPLSGSRSVFKILDTVHIFNDTEEKYANIVMPYQPLAIKQNLSAIQKSVETGFSTPLPPHITININIVSNTGDNGTITINNNAGISLQENEQILALKSLAESSDNPFARKALAALSVKKKDE